MKNMISINECKSYVSEKNLDNALTKLGLDYCDPSGENVPIRYVKVRNSQGRWTAIFLVSEHIRVHGGYIGIASQCGFMSV